MQQRASYPAPGGWGIAVQSLTHQYLGDQENLLAVDDVAFVVPERSFLSIIGPSGCGKTTILDILSGLLAVQGGSVLVGNAPPRPGRKDVARMFARDVLLPWRTAHRNIDFALRTRVPSRNERRAIIQDQLRAVGLEGFANAYPSALSQGMRQRVALARTFALGSQYVFLDEPFGALDALTRLALQDRFLQLWERHRSTVVLVTHDLGEAITLSDRVLVMSARPGRIVADVEIPLRRPRSVEALQQMPEYHALYAKLWKELATTFDYGDFHRVPTAIVNGTSE